MVRGRAPPRFNSAAFDVPSTTTPLIMFHSTAVAATNARPAASTRSRADWLGCAIIVDLRLTNPVLSSEAARSILPGTSAKKFACDLNATTSVVYAAILIGAKVAGLRWSTVQASARLSDEWIALSVRAPKGLLEELSLRIHAGPLKSVPVSLRFLAFTYIERG
jgi:hypothetical protein